MKSLRSILLVAVMGTVAYGLYVSLTKNSGPSFDETDPPPAWREAEGSGGSAPSFGQAEYGAVPPTTLLPEQDGMPPLSSVPHSTVGHSHETPPAALPEMATERPLPEPAHMAPYEPETGSAVASSASPNVTQASRYEGVDDSDGFAEARITSTPNPAATSDPADAQLHDLFGKAIEAAQQLIAQNQTLDALEGLSAWYAHERLSSEEHAVLNGMLDKLAGEVIYDYNVHLLSRAHVTAPGDSLQSIATQYQLPAELVGKINGIAPGTTLTPGTTLKVIPGPFSVDVNLTTNTLTLFIQDSIYAGRFPIGMGRELPALEGDYVVTTKIENPPYYDQFAAGDPQNPLGTRWIGMGEKCGIHGTNNPQSVGSEAQEGSIRMLSGDAEDLYDILTVQQSKVIVHR